jgi:hypothetical protein
VACSRTEQSSEAGWATAAAITVCLGLALGAAALSALASTELAGARRSLERLQAEFAFDDAQKTAALAVLKADQSTRLQWRLTIKAGGFEALAEPEAAKLSPEAAAALDEDAFARLGAADPRALRERLARVADHDADLRDLDSSPVWSGCAASLVSPFGLARQLTPSPAARQPEELKLDLRPGEVWRLRIRGADGWTDDRLVRFTGDALRPVAVIRRTFTRRTKEPICPTI